MVLPIHPHLLVLRTLVTIQLSLVLAQAGWAAATLGNRGDYMGLHAIGAVATLACSVAVVVAMLVLRRSAGPVLLVLSIVTLAIVVAQYVLGQLRIADVHIFTGVLVAIAVTALTSWTYRHRLPDQST